MKVGELFVSLGITGGDKTIGTLTGVRKGMSDVASVSLEAKAGILAAIYALERLVSSSNQAGTGLTNFQATTGMSLEMLQRYQYAGMQAGATNDEVAGSFKALQASMDAIARGASVPEGLQYISQAVGSIDFDKASKDTEYLFQQMTKFSQLKDVDPARKMWALSSMGQSGNVIAAMERNKFTTEIMSKAPIYSTGEAGQLDRINASWKNLGNTIEHAIGKLNAKHGMSLIKDITMLIGPVSTLVGEFIKLAETVKVFEAISITIQGIAGAITSLNETIAAFHSSDSSKYTGITKSVLDFKNGIKDPKKVQEAWTSLPNTIRSNIGPQQHNEINQNLHFHGDDGKDHKKAADTHKKTVNAAFRQIPTLGQYA